MLWSSVVYCWCCSQSRCTPPSHRIHITGLSDKTFWLADFHVSVCQYILCVVVSEANATVGYRLKFVYTSLGGRTYPSPVSYLLLLTYYNLLICPSLSIFSFPSMSLLTLFQLISFPSRYVSPSLLPSLSLCILALSPPFCLSPASALPLSLPLPLCLPPSSAPWLCGSASILLFPPFLCRLTLYPLLSPPFSRHLPLPCNCPSPRPCHIPVTAPLSAPVTAHLSAPAFAL